MKPGRRSVESIVDKTKRNCFCVHLASHRFASLAPSHSSPSIVNHMSSVNVLGQV